MAQITAKELRNLRDVWILESAPCIYNSDFYKMFKRAVGEPTPHVVRYFADRGGVLYTPPDRIYMGYRTQSPSDCEWFVPGTLKG